MKKYIILLLLFLITLGINAQDKFIISNDSKLTIEGTSTVHDWTVIANTIEGTVHLETNAPKEIDFQVTVVDILSERGATMDTKMHAALQHESHPKVIFKLKEVKNESNLIGTLSIAGRESEVEILAKMDTSGDTLKISGEYDIALKDFEIEPPTAMFGQVIVGGDVKVKFDLIFGKE